VPTALLTGATGLIGGDVCRLLLAQGWRVVALVRSDAAILGNDGQALASDALTRIYGDISQPACGLGQPQQDWLAQKIDLVIHCAATTAFNADDVQYDSHNFDGTAHVLALAPDTPFLHVSTAYVCGRQGGLIEEAACRSDTQFGNGYERSKAAAEARVAESRRPWLIARPSIVVGASTDGRIRRFDAIYGAFKLLAEGRAATLPATGAASLNFVPVDFVAEALVALAGKTDGFAGEFVHLASRQPMSVEDFVNAIGSYPGFHSPRLVDPSAFDPTQLRRGERMLFDRVLKHYLPYFQRSPCFQTDAITRLTGMQSPLFDRPMLQRLIDFALAAGFLRPSRPNAHRDNDPPTVRARLAPTLCRP
jgi:2-alkyl-3-oxoalkanoate reductase